MVRQVIRPIENWRKAWKFASVQWNVVGILCMLLEIVQQTWQSLPPAIAEQIPNSSRIALVLFLLATVGRLIKLKEKQDGSS